MARSRSLNVPDPNGYMLRGVISMRLWLSVQRYSQGINQSPTGTYVATFYEHDCGAANLYLRDRLTPIRLLPDVVFNLIAVDLADG